jgi:RNA polymerase-binding transcription factor DksA
MATMKKTVKAQAAAGARQVKNVAAKHAQAAPKRPATRKEPAQRHAAAKVKAAAHGRHVSAAPAKPAVVAPARRTARPLKAAVALPPLSSVKRVLPYGLQQARHEKPAVTAGHEVTLSKSEKTALRALLMASRVRIAQQVGTLKQESLQSREEVTSSEDGTDAFERQFALSVASSEQDAVIDIDDALRRLDAGVYGVCETCGCAIGKKRLKALPFVRFCVKCQSESERHRPRFHVME